MQPAVWVGAVGTALGRFGLAVTRLGVRAVVLPGPDLEARLWYASGVGEPVEDPTALGELAERLAAYCSGEPVLFDDLALDVAGTPFQLAVWQATRAIPRGQTRTYREIAAQVGRPGASRAVGAAEGANPVAIIVPCHRVVGSDGALRGFGGGLPLKARLLALEGARLLPV